LGNNDVLPKRAAPQDASLINQEQRVFSFIAEAPVVPSGTARRKVVATKKPATAAPDVEFLAQQVQAHPDYRVLRRLKPCLDWPGVASGQLVQLVLLDTETTGLDRSKDKIIELAMLRVAVDAQTGMPVGGVSVYDALEDPGQPIPREVQALTGITNAMVRGQRLDEAGIARMLSGADLVVAHNAAFDRPFAEARFEGFSTLPWACSIADIDWKAQGRSSARLENLANAMGWFYNAHRAEMDCHALLTVLAAPLPGLTQTGLAHLLTAAARPSFRLQASGAPFEAKDLLKNRSYRWNKDLRVWHTSLPDEEALQAECEWLRTNVYGQRGGQVLIEKLDASSRYSARTGTTEQHAL
jgi:DNA polymerase-3 subunit epsilon